MNKHHFLPLLPVLTLIFVLWSSLYSFSEDIESQKRATISIMDLKPAGGITQQEALLLTDRFLIELARTSYYEVTERDRRDEILKEVSFQQTGVCDEASCLARAGKYLGVQKMVGGTIGGLGETFSVCLRMVDVETGRIEKGAVKDYQGSIDNLLTEAMHDMAWQFVPTEVAEKYREKISKLKKEQDMLEAARKGEGPSGSKMNPWTTRAFMLAPRSGLAACVANNKIYAIGGANEGRYLADVEEYDPLRNAWNRKADILVPRHSLIACAASNNILAIGGLAGRKVRNVVEEYDAGKNKWTQRTSMPTPRRSLATGTVISKIYAVGGWDGKGASSAVEVYDPITDTWSSKRGLSTPREDLAVGVAYNMVYAIGGTDGQTILATVEEYDPLTNTWLTKTPMPTPRSHLMVGVVNNKIYAIGGTDGRGVLATVEEYDPISNTWTTKSPMPVARAAGATCVMNNRIFVIGGTDRQTGLSVVERYDPSLDP